MKIFAMGICGIEDVSFCDAIGPDPCLVYSVMILTKSEKHVAIGTYTKSSVIDKLDKISKQCCAEATIVQYR